MVVVKIRAGFPRLAGAEVFAQAPVGVVGSLLLLAARLAGRRHVLDDLAQDKWFAIARQRQPHSVNVGRTPDVTILDSASRSGDRSRPER